MSSLPPIHYIFVEGSIGAGKSVLLDRVQQRLRKRGIVNLVAVPEPLNAWRDCHGHNVLELFYSDPKRWALAFQTHAMSTRVAAVRRAIEEHTLAGDEDIVVLCERSVHTDRHVFVEMLAAAGTLSEAEKAMYVTAYDYYVPHAYPGNEAGVVYLRATPERCAQHIAARERAEESSIALDYLRQLHERHEAAIGSTNAWPGAERLTLNVDTLGAVPSDDKAARRCTDMLHVFITKVCGSNAVRLE